MEKELWQIGSFLPVIILIISDLKYRQISSLWLAFFGLTTLATALFLFPLQTVGMHIGINLLLLAYLGGGIMLYLRIRYRKESRPLTRRLGSGDWLFVLCLTPLFALQEFLWLLIASFILSLAGWGLYRILTKCSTTIPLVSALGIVFILYTTLKWITQ